MRGARAGGSLRARGWSMAENSVFNFPNVLATNQLFHQLMHHQSSMSPSQSAAPAAASVAACALRTQLVMHGAMTG